MSRGLSSELDAVFSMLGLEKIAEPLLDFMSSPGAAVAMVGYLAARAAAGSANRLDDELADDRVWGRIRGVAESQGRDLPVSPPTFNKLHHLRRRIDAVLPTRFDEVLVDMGNAFNEPPAVHPDGSRYTLRGMCRPATCSKCGKTTWAGCGAHVDQVMAEVPPGERCTCDRSTGGAGRKWFRR